jgi:hypothetical protein
MNIIQMLSDLRAELQHIEEAIVVVQRLATGQGRRRGRPPKWMKESSGTLKPSSAPISPIKGKRKPFSASTRKKMAEAQRKRWAARKAKAA